ncbi:ankyrin-3-like isoform X2 [Corticium candelabrum]|uniref:ankyrin-3-like isoform X2 n=1 Tax=Corticium candelabrum TaxID=121492 RepID=UPI002E25B7AA|nr:ankyrin-3-like isoform X2 [Corticium candelabrum]
MIGKSADVNVVAKRGGKYGTGWWGYPSALQVTCGVGSTDSFELLVRKQANVKYQEKLRGYTALHYASNGGHVSIMKRLISVGCNQQVKNHYGETALHVADDVEVIDYLLNIGLNTEDHDKGGYTPFLRACLKCRLPVVQCLIQSMCNKAATTNFGETALHIAGNVEVVDYLLSVGLNIEGHDEWGNTPFLTACRDGRLPVVQRLIQSKCNKAATTNDGSTALHLICSKYDLTNDHLSIVRLLTSLRVDVSAKSDEGQTPLQAAKEQLYSDDDDSSTAEIRSHIISHLRGLNENSFVAAGNSPSSITDSTTAVADNDHPILFLKVVQAQQQ